MHTTAGIANSPSVHMYIITHADNVDSIFGKYIYTQTCYYCNDVMITSPATHFGIKMEAICKYFHSRKENCQYSRLKCERCILVLDTCMRLVLSYANSY